MEGKKRMSCSLAIPFALNNEYNEVAGEFNIVFKQSRDHSLVNLIEFAEEFPDKRINIKLETYDINIPRTINKIHSNIYVKLWYGDLVHRDEDGQFKILKELQENNIKYYFGDYISDLQSLDTFINYLKTKEIYIAGDLLYRLPEVRAYCDDHDVKIRFIPNQAYIWTIEDSYNPRTFFMPPDCFYFFERYFDSIEFKMKQEYNWHEFGVYYRAWIEKKRWHGNLQEIIFNLNFPVYNDSFDGIDLLRYKILCKRKCCIQIPCSCKKCEQFLQIADDLNDKQIILNKVNPQ